MKRLRWPPWKFWNRIPEPSKRRVHLGIDYGTSVSKIVFRDNHAPIGESAVLVLCSGSFRIPSRVCMTATTLLFGADTKAAADCAIYESLKMRVPAEVSGQPEPARGGPAMLPRGFSSADLAALTVWFLTSEGHRAVAAHLNGHMEGVHMSMTMGLPTPFFNDKQLRASFLKIARRAWALYSSEGLVNSTLSVEKARGVLEKHPATLPAIADQEVQEWIENRDIVAVNRPIDIIRSEDEAGLWWLLRSPSVRPGAYAKVDIGAGSTHANLFRIFGAAQTVRRSLVRYGAAAVPVGIDAIDRAIAKCPGWNRDCLALRGLEQSSLKANANTNDALTPVGEQICDSYQKAWSEACVKMGGNALELSSWRQHKLIVTGGGSRMPFLVDMIRTHPDHRQPLSVMALQQPTDLIRADHKKLGDDELPFLTAAYGLSSMESFLPNPYCRDPGSFAFGRH